MMYQHIITDKLVALDLGEVGSSLSLFASEIRKIFPKCSFAPILCVSPALMPNSRSLIVYHKNRSVAMGWVGVSDVIDESGFDTVNEPITTYYVNSRKVSNDRYTGEQHYIVKTGNPEVAIRNVKKYFVEYNAVEIAKLNKRNTWSLWRKTLSQMIEDTHRLREEVCYAVVPGSSTSARGWKSDPLIAELRVLVDTGYKFVDAEFDEKVRAWLSAEAEQLKETNERSFRIMMVSVEDSLFNEGNLYVTAYTDNIEENNGSTSLWTTGGTFVEDTLDPDILRKLSALQLVEQNSWVDGVGFKSSERVYYVIR